MREGVVFAMPLRSALPASDEGAARYDRRMSDPLRNGPFVVDSSRPEGQAQPVDEAAVRRLNERRRWGYWVWGIAAGVILVPELIAAFSAGWLPFTTISKL